MTDDGRKKQHHQALRPNKWGQPFGRGYQLMVIGEWLVESGEAALQLKL
jgi:hypothetical protein